MMVYVLLHLTNVPLVSPLIFLPNSSCIKGPLCLSMATSLSQPRFKNKVSSHAEYLTTLLPCILPCIFLSSKAMLTWYKKIKSTVNMCVFVLFYSTPSFLVRGLVLCQGIKRLVHNVGALTFTETTNHLQLKGKM